MWILAPDWRTSTSPDLIAALFGPQLIATETKNGRLRFQEKKLKLPRISLV